MGILFQLEAELFIYGAFMESEIFASGPQVTMGQPWILPKVFVIFRILHSGAQMSKGKVLMLLFPSDRKPK